MLLASELARIKAELGINVLTLGAEPYIGVTALFEQVIQPHVSAGAVTSSSTPVTASSSTAGSLVTLTLADATQVAQFDRLVIDIDDFQEVATCRRVNASTVDVFLKLAHSGTYPVIVEGGESLIREKLVFIRTLTAKIQKAASAAGLKSVDDVEFFSAVEMGLVNGLGVAGALWKQREAERRELSAIIGIGYPRDMITGGGGTVEVY